MKYLVLALMLVGCGPQMSVHSFKDSVISSPTLSITLGTDSIRESAAVYSEEAGLYIVIADVLPRDNPSWPNTYDSDIHYWTSPDLSTWTHRGVAVEKGKGFDGRGVGSPAGAAILNHKVYAAFSGRVNLATEERFIGIAWKDLNDLNGPFNRTLIPVNSLLNSDDAAVVSVPGDTALHLYHRANPDSGPFAIFHSSSETPEDPASWSTPTQVTFPSAGMDGQEMTAAFYSHGQYHLLVMQHERGDYDVFHMCAPTAEGPFVYSTGAGLDASLPKGINYMSNGAHATPVMNGTHVQGFLFTAWQNDNLYNLQGTTSWSLPAGNCAVD